jgi:hypothetical protein
VSYGVCRTSAIDVTSFEFDSVIGGGNDSFPAAASVASVLSQK